VHGTLQGIATQDPAFGLEAVWIESGQRELAQSYGYTVVDPATVIATHLSHILQGHAHELLSHQDVQQLLDRLAATAPKLVEDLVPKRLSLGVVVKVLQNLLAERVPIRNMRIIGEALAEHAAQSQDPGALTVAVSVAGAAVERGIADRLQPSVAEVARRPEMHGEPAVLLVAPQLRHWLERFT